MNPRKLTCPPRQVQPLVRREQFSTATVAAMAAAEVVQGDEQQHCADGPKHYVHPQSRACG